MLFRSLFLSIVVPMIVVGATAKNVFYSPGDSFCQPGGTLEFSLSPITPGEGGIKEDVPSKYRGRFEKWKSELLATSFGRAEWERYATRKDFVLTIKVTNDRGKGAGTDKFRWDNNGNFIGATITLGSDIDQGYPTPVYYPVLNSLSSNDTIYFVNGSILAATKISHEIGHVNQAGVSNPELLELQDRLMPQYIAIFLKNGLNTRDRKLIDLADQMGGTPIEIWERREYGSEVSAMNYLSERLGNEEFYCDVLSRIRQNLTSYAREYEHLFAEDLRTNGRRCGK